MARFIFAGLFLSLPPTCHYTDVAMSVDKVSVLQSDN